jgi:hypothetical protein
MSYQHTQRRKTIKRFKKEVSKGWYLKFREHTARILSERFGPPIGTLEDIVVEVKEKL